jgi:hypothetical protein
MALTTIILLSIFIFSGDADDIGDFLIPLLWVYLIFFVLVVISTRIVVGGHYALNYVIDEKGFLITGSRDRAQTFKWMAVAAGVLSGKPGLTGAGLLVKDDNEIFISWKDADEVRVDRAGNRVIIEASFWKQVAMHYPEELEEKVEGVISHYIKE